MIESAIKCLGISKEFKGNNLVKALENVSFEVPRGELFGLLGPNGAGKTTLIRILTTLLIPTSGTAEIDGYHVIQQAPMVRKITGYAGQDTERSAYLRLTVRENLIFFAHAFRGIGLKESGKRIDAISEQLDFTENLGKQFSPMSGGEKQLVILIRSLIHQPRILFLDEPSKNLDPVTSKKVRNFVRRYAREHAMTVLLTTHNMAEADELCEKLAFIHKGELRFLGTPKEFKSTVTVHEVVEVKLRGDKNSTISRLEGFPGVRNVVKGDTIKVYCDRAIDVLPEICNLLKKTDPDASVKTLEPSLEDAYSIFVDGSQENMK